MSLLALGALAALLALAALRARASHPVTLGWLVVAYLAPTIWLAHTLATVGPQGTRLRVALLGFGFRAAPEAPLDVVIGGDRERHDVWVSARDPTGLRGSTDRTAEADIGRVHWPAAGSAGDAPSGAAVRPLVELQIASASGALGIFESAPADVPWRWLGMRTRYLHPLGVLALADGDVIECCETRLTLEQRRGLVPQATLRRPDGTAVSLTRRPMELPLVGWTVSLLRPLPGTSETYRVADMVHPLTAPDAPRSEPVQAFLFRQPALDRHTLWLCVLPGDALVVRRGGTVIAPEPPRPLGSGARFSVLGLPRRGEDGLHSGGVRDRRSFQLLTSNTSLVLALDTPEIQVVPWKTVEELAQPQKPQTRGAATSAPPLRVNLAFGDWQITENSLHLAHVARRIGSEAVATLELPADAREASLGAGLSASTPAGHREGRFGEPLWLGTERLAAVQLDVIQPPLALVVLGLALGWIKCVVARALMFTHVQAALAAASEALLAARLAIAWRAFALPPFSEEALRLSLIAWVVLPWGLLAASLPPATTDSRRDWHGASRRGFGRRIAAVTTPGGLILAGLFFSWAWTLRCGSASAARAVFWSACHVLLAVLAWQRRTGAPGRAGRALRAAIRRAWHALRRIGGRRETQAAPVGWRSSRGSETDRSHRLHAWLRAWLPSPALRGAVTTALAVGLARVGLLVFGARESWGVGGERFALSLIHIPAAIAIQAWFFTGWTWHLRRPGPPGGLTTSRYSNTRRWWRLFVDATTAANPGDRLALLLVPIALWLVPAFAVSDIGLLLLNLPVFLAGLVLVTEPVARAMRADGQHRRARVVRWVVWVPLVLYLGGTAVRPLLQAVLWGWQTLRSEERTSELDSERNYLRLLEFAYPERLREVARRDSDRLAVMSTVMRAYTTVPFTGRGYFTSELSPHLRATTLREHAPAVFVAAEWGAAGVTGLLLVYLSFALLGGAWLDARGVSGERRPTGQRIAMGVSALAALTLAIPSVYMLLANYRLTLFTGKNPYLLGLDSTADVLETCVLLVLAAWAAASDGDRAVEA